MKSYKTEIKLNNEQKILHNKTIGVCRFIYNLYINYNKEMYEKEKKFVSAYDFSKYLNNEFIPNNIEYSWIKEVSSKSIKHDLNLKDRIYKCEACGFEVDRDYNASINLREAKEYNILVPVTCRELTTMECYNNCSSLLRSNKMRQNTKKQ